MVGRVAASAIPFSVSIVVLLRLDVGAHVFWRHQPNVMPVAREQASEMTRPDAGFHGYDARRQFGDQTD
jgi:hypothetical protein